MQTHYAGSSLDELLADDLIQTMMDADHVNPAVVRSLFCALARTARARNVTAPATHPALLASGLVGLAPPQSSASARAAADCSQGRTSSNGG